MKTKCMWCLKSHPQKQINCPNMSSEARKKPMKTICLWCGESHKTKRPKSCKNASALMSAICKKIPAWKAMRCLEVYGLKGLETLGIELGLYRFVK